MKQKIKGANFSSMLFHKLSASLLANLLTSKSTIRAGEGKIKAGQAF